MLLRAAGRTGIQSWRIRNDRASYFSTQLDRGWLHVGKTDTRQECLHEKTYCINVCFA